MTFQEALEKIRDAQKVRYAISIGDIVLALAEQVEVNRVDLSAMRVANQRATIALQGELKAIRELHDKHWHRANEGQITGGPQ